MALSCMPAKNCCIITKSSGQSARTTNAKQKALISGRDGPHSYCGRKALNHQIFVGYLQYEERKHLYTEFCSDGYGGSTMTKKLHKKGIRTNYLVTMCTSATVKTIMI